MTHPTNPDGEVTVTTNEEQCAALDWAIQQASAVPVRGILRALESLRAAQPAAVDREAVAWQVRRSDGRIDGVPIQWEQCTKDLYDATLSTGRYAGYENGPRCEVRELYAAPLDKDAGKPAAAQGWALTRQQHPADDECEAMDTILVQGPKGERHIAYDIPGVGHALYAFLDAMLAASTVAPSVEQDERGAEYGSTDFGYTFAGINLEEGDKRLMAMLVSALGTEHPAIEDLTALLFRAASTSANVAQGAENYEEFLQWFREHYRFIFSAGTERHAEKIWNAISAPPVQTALTVTPVMVKAAMPWLTGLHYMRKTDKESHVEEAIKAALTVAQSASGLQEDA